MRPANRKELRCGPRTLNIIWGIAEQKKLSYIALFLEKSSFVKLPPSLLDIFLNETKCAYFKES
jgi:hypothetical protein